MEVDFILCCLFMLCLTLCVGLTPLGLPVNCTGCVCESHNGARLLLNDVFNDPISTSCSNSNYCFPSCLKGKLEGKPCRENDTSDLVCVSNSKIAKKKCWNDSTVYIQTEITNITNNSHSYAQWSLDNDTKQCHIVITCSPMPVQQLNDIVVFNASNCGKLKAFVSSASTNITAAALSNSTSTILTSSSPSTTLSSSVIPSSKTHVSFTTANITSTANATLTLSSSPTPLTSSVTPSSSSVMPSSSSVPPQPPPSDNNSDSKVLYIVIPIAAPLAFVISFIISFCLLNWCHQRNKKKLYIKLTSTIYAEDDDSDDSDD